ncbi:MAG: hypothetical protein LW808_002565 [Verrucomicrobiota bacterium]|nr:MAG: hypothetical protein LW808_002565 [Verrucomicrobiota bacterium]
MKLNIRKNCIILTLLTGSSLFGSTNAHHQGAPQAPVAAHQQAVTPDIDTLEAMYLEFLSNPHNPDLVPYCAILMDILEAINALKRTTIFQDIQRIPHTCKMDDLALRFGYDFHNIDDLQRLVDLLERWCALMLTNGMSNPMGQVNVTGGAQLLFRMNKHNKDARTISRYAKLAQHLNLINGKSVIYYAIEKLNKTLGVILAKENTFPTAFVCPRDFYIVAHMVQILLAFFIQSSAKIYAIGDDRNAFNSRYAPMPFANKESLWFLPSYVPVPAVNFQLTFE